MPWHAYTQLRGRAPPKRAIVLLCSKYFNITVTTLQIERSLGNLSKFNGHAALHATFIFSSSASDIIVLHIYPAFFPYIRLLGVLSGSPKQFRTQVSRDTGIRSLNFCKYILDHVISWNHIRYLGIKLKFQKISNHGA